jgi:hypothetical protein
LRISRKKTRIRSYREKYHQAFDILLGCCFSRCTDLPTWTLDGHAAGAIPLLSNGRDPKTP